MVMDGLLFAAKLYIVRYQAGGWPWCVLTAWSMPLTCSPGEPCTKRAYPRRLWSPEPIASYTWKAIHSWATEDVSAKSNPVSSLILRRR